MFHWQTKALRLEESALQYLDGVVADYGIYLFVGFVYLLIPFSIWALSGRLRRKVLNGKHMPHIQPGIVIHFPVGRPTPPPEPSEQFPPVREPLDYDDND